MNELDMMHGHDWQGEDLAGWLMTEKLDGCRAYWDGATLWTRGGKISKLPEHWHLPAGIALDGELYDGGGTAGRARCASALRYGHNHLPAVHLPPPRRSRPACLYQRRAGPQIFPHRPITHMPIHYIPARALRLCCRWVAERATPHKIPVVVSRVEPADNGTIVLLDRLDRRA